MRALFAAVAVAVGVVACSSTDSGGGDTTPKGDAGDDSSIATPLDSGKPPNMDASGTVSGDSSTRATACTAGPFVAYSATLTKLTALGGDAPLEGAQIGFTTCAGFELTTSAAGEASTQLTQGVAVTPLYAQSGVISAIGAEIPATGAVTESIAMFDDTLTPYIPGFSPDGGSGNPILEIVLAFDAAATAPCNTTSGVTLSVTGHPEATVSYMGATWPNDPNVASTTASTDGTRAFIAGITGASKVQITGTKSGCQVASVTASQTGNFVLLAGAVTIGTATVTN